MKQPQKTMVAWMIPNTGNYRVDDKILSEDELTKMRALMPEKDFIMVRYKKHLSKADLILTSN